MLSKKAVSHIEMILSFVLFSLFVFFLLFFLNPVRNQSITNVFIDAIQNNLEQNATIQLMELPLNVKEGFANCFSIPNPFNTTEPKNILVKDTDGRVLKISISGDTLNVEKSTSGEEFYYLQYGNILLETAQLEMIYCTALNKSGYNYAASRTYELIYMPRLRGIKNEYEDAYTQLREEFNFPLSYDFAVNVADSATKQSILSMIAKKPERVEVNARDIPIEILYENGVSAKAEMNIQVW